MSRVVWIGRRPSAAKLKLLRALKRNPRPEPFGECWVDDSKHCAFRVIQPKWYKGQTKYGCANTVKHPRCRMACTGLTQKQWARY